MNGPQHFERAQQLLEEAAAALATAENQEVLADEAAGDQNYGLEHDHRRAAREIRRSARILREQSLVHATLAQAAATVLSGVLRNTVAASHAVNELAHDDETITAVNDWHEVAAR